MSRWAILTSRVLLGALALAVLAFVGVCIVLRLGYRTLLYPAPRGPADAPVPSSVVRLDLRARDGVSVHALELPAPPGARTIVVFHGNGERMEYLVGLGLDLHRRGFGVVLAEYRGYGVSADVARPSEPGLYADGEAIVDDLRARGAGADRVVLMGFSLGTGIAAEMASRGRGSALVLVSPYTSIATLADGVIPIVPAGWLCPDKYDTLSKAAAIRVPTLIIHGDQDDVVPVAMGRTLASAIPGASLHIVRGGHHNDLFAVHADEVVPLLAVHAGK